MWLLQDRLFDISDQVRTPNVMAAWQMTSCVLKDHLVTVSPLGFQF